VSEGARAGAAPREMLLILVLAACSAIGPISTLLAVPAMPSIRDEFGVTTAAVQGIVSVFLVAFAFGIPFAGPLSDRYGRRPLLLWGLGVFCAGSALCALAPSIGALLSGRAVQAIGSAILLTVARAAIGDLYQDWRLARALANLTLAMMLGTSFSPLIGGQIAVLVGWQGAFWALVAIGALTAVATWRLLPETRPRTGPPTSLAALGRSSLQVLRNSSFLAISVDVGVIYAIYLVFISVAAFVMQEMGRPATEFGQYTLLVSAGYFLGNLYIARRGNARNMERLAQLGCWLQAGSALLALGLVLAGLTHPIFWFGPMLPLAFGQGLTLPHRTATAVRLVPGYSGVASSVIGFTQQLVAGLAVQAMGFARTDTPVPVLALCTILSLLSLATMLALRPRAAPARAG
jgi:DHA1 family bicyclomycin/chloramphenicol resistance-like MFS transporter